MTETQLDSRPAARPSAPYEPRAIAEAYVYGAVDVEGDMEAAAALGDAASRRLRSPRTLARLLPLVLALPRDRSGGGGREAPAGAARRAARVRGLARHGRLHSEARDRA